MSRHPSPYLSYALHSSTVSYSDQQEQLTMSQPKTPLRENSFDNAPEHKKLYETGLQIRKQVVGEDYVERSLENGSSDFLRPIQQFATVSTAHLTPILHLPRSFHSTVHGSR
jgi:hypothetical protein